MSKLNQMYKKKYFGNVTIAEITNEHILFSNGSEITYDHQADCCECNYADFNQVDIPKKIIFTLPLSFERVDGSGFRFGNPPQKMFFVPCYSEQNGYYSDDIDIYFNGREVLNLACEDIFF